MKATRWDSIFSGLALAAILAWVAMVLQKLSSRGPIHLNSLIIVIVLGMLIKNTVGVSPTMLAGTRFASKKILRLAIILLGFRLSFAQIASMGFRALGVVFVVVFSTMYFSIWLGRKVGLDDKLACLLGAGTSICGASAVVAVGSVVDADEQETAFAIAAVTLFGTLAMFMYPIIYQIGGLNEVFYGVWAGVSIHEVAQVVAAGFSVNSGVGEIATLIKLTRVILLVPVTMTLCIRKVRQQKEPWCWGNVAIPWFVLGFLAVVFINSLGIVPEELTRYIIRGNGFLLTWAMAGLGLETSLAKMKQVGIKPFYVGLMSWFFIAIAGYIMTRILIV